MKNKVSDDTLAESYNRLGSSTKVAKELNMSSATVAYRLKKIGILKKHQKNIDIELIKKLYFELNSIYMVAKQLNVSREYIRYHLKNTGIINKKVKYTCNENFFSTDTPESFYWAGFIAADGCVKLESKKYKYTYIGLARDDEGHLYKFKKAINFNGPVSQHNGKYKSSEINIRSDKLFDDLARFNIVQRKSLILEFPEWLSSHPLVHHFLRGYFDGDGGISLCEPYKPGRKIKQLYSSLRGTENFLSHYINILSKHCGIKEKKPNLSSGIYRLEFGGNRLNIKIRDFLYKDSNETICLDRKYNIFYSDYIKNLPESFVRKKVMATHINTGEILYFNSTWEARKFGFTPPSISAACRGLYKTHKNYIWKYI